MFFKNSCFTLNKGRFDVFLVSRCLFMVSNILKRYEDILFLRALLRPPIVPVKEIAAFY